MGAGDTGLITQMFDFQNAIVVNKNTKNKSTITFINYEYMYKNMTLTIRNNSLH